MTHISFFETEKIFHFIVSSSRHRNGWNSNLFIENNKGSYFTFARKRDTIRREREGKTNSISYLASFCGKVIKISSKDQSGAMEG